MTVQCSMCWGQSIIYEEARNGEGLIPTQCESCLGTGFDMTEQQAVAIQSALEFIFEEES